MNLCYRLFPFSQVVVSGVPIIRMATEDLTFKYAGDRGGGTLLAKLGEKILQRRLARGDREAIMRWEIISYRRKLFFKIVPQANFLFSLLFRLDLPGLFSKMVPRVFPQPTYSPPGSNPGDFSQHAPSRVSETCRRQHSPSLSWAP